MNEQEHVCNICKQGINTTKPHRLVMIVAEKSFNDHFYECLNCRKVYPFMTESVKEKLQSVRHTLFGGGA